MRTNIVIDDNLMNKAMKASVWIDYFNGIDNRHTDALDIALQEGTEAAGDLIYLEIL